MRKLAMLAVLAVGACGPNVDGDWTGTWSAGLGGYYGKQTGAVRIAVKDGAASGAGTNDTIGAPFDVGGTVAEDGTASLLYTYPSGATYQCAGKLLLDDDTASGMLSMEYQGDVVGSVKLSLTRQ